MKKTIFFLFIGLTIGTCLGIAGLFFYQKQELDEFNLSKYIPTSMDSLKTRIWLYGDADAYTELRNIYRECPPEYFLSWAMYMANKYEYPYAYEDVFTTMEDFCYRGDDSAILKMDSTTRQFALGYLKKAAAKNDSSAIATLDEIKKKVPSEWLK